MEVPFELPRLRIESAHASRAPGPNDAARVGAQRPHTVMTEGRGIAAAPVRSESLSIVSVQASFRADPDESPAVLRDGSDKSV